MANRATQPEAPAVASEIVPVWLRVPDAVALTGISRSGLYELFDFVGGPIRTACIKRRSRTRGVRLIERRSLLSFVESCAGRSA